MGQLRGLPTFHFLLFFRRRCSHHSLPYEFDVPESTRTVLGWCWGTSWGPSVPSKLLTLKHIRTLVSCQKPLLLSRIILIFIWLAGDLYKLSYYMANTSPLALKACASFQIMTDTCILAQFVIYRNNTKKENARITASQKKEYQQSAN